MAKCASSLRCFFIHCTTRYIPHLINPLEIFYQSSWLRQRAWFLLKLLSLAQAYCFYIRKEGTPFRRQAANSVTFLSGSHTRLRLLFPDIFFVFRMICCSIFAPSQPRERYIVQNVITPSRHFRVSSICWVFFCNRKIPEGIVATSSLGLFHFLTWLYLVGLIDKTGWQAKQKLLWPGWGQNYYRNCFNYHVLQTVARLSFDLLLHRFVNFSSSTLYNDMSRYNDMSSAAVVCFI